MRTSESVSSFGRKASILALVLSSGLAALAVTPVRAMDAAAVEEHKREKQERESAPPARQEQRQEPRRDSRPAIAPQAGAPQAGAPPAVAAQRQDSRGGGRPEYRNEGFSPRNRDGVVYGPPRGTQGPDARIVPPSRSYGYNRPPPPSRVVQRLPPGYRQYNWGGSPYYHNGGRWYRPYGSSYMIVGAPFGLFVPFLPNYYTTFWYGGSRYYFADDTYYLYEPSRRGYVVSRSPYGDDRDDEDSDYDSDGGSSTPDHELYVYPTRGQGEKQQADDRYECHRWAVDQAHYDPTDAEYRAEDRTQYDRALTACLTGRGYSVK